MAPPLCPATAAAAADARAAAHPGSRSPSRPRFEGHPECGCVTSRGARSSSSASLRPARWTVSGPSVAVAPLAPLPGGRSGPSGRRRCLSPLHTQVRAGDRPGCPEALLRAGVAWRVAGSRPHTPPREKKGLRPLDRASFGTAGCPSSRCSQLHIPSVLGLSREEPPREPCQAGGGRSFLK